MTTIRPQWQSDNGEPVRISVKGKSISNASAPVKASRKPAALLGIGIVIAMVVTITGGLSGLSGQVNDVAYTIRITKQGMQPQHLTVAPGSTVTFRNESDIPHILSSDTLPTADGIAFESSAMFPGSSTRTLIPQDAEAGTYAIFSKTAKDITGEITIEAVTVSVPVALPTVPTIPTESSSSEESSASSAPVQAAVIEPVPAPQVPVQNQFTPPVQAAAVGVPVNPHSLLAGDAPIETDYHAGAPIEASTGYKPSVTGHKPDYNTASGPAEGVVLALSIAALLLMTQRSFRRIVIVD